MKYFTTMLSGCVNEWSSHSTVWGKHTNSCQFNLGYWWCHKQTSLSSRQRAQWLAPCGVRTQSQSYEECFRILDIGKTDETKTYGHTNQFLRVPALFFWVSVSSLCLCLFFFIIPSARLCLLLWLNSKIPPCFFFRGLHSFHSVACSVAALTSGAKAAAGQIELDKVETPPRDDRSVLEHRRLPRQARHRSDFPLQPHLACML